MLHEVSDSQSNARELLLGNIDAVRDILAAQVAGEEASGQLSRESSDALYNAGVLQMKLPGVLGGHEADLVTQFEVLEKLATINPAAAWCAMVGATSLGMPGAFLPDGGIDRMFAGGRIPRGAILIMPSGKAVPESGGYRLSGRWAFASGVHHAEWISAHGLVQESGDAPPRLYMFAFPAAEITIHDNWDVLGLRGTGSCDISVDNIFVPADCAWDVEAQPPQRGGPLYRLGIPAFVAYEHAAFATGIARRALDTVTELAKTKKRGYGPGAKALAERESVQRLIGHSELKLRSARSLAVDLNQQAMDVINAGGNIDPELALELRSTAVYCTEVAGEIITDAFRYAGASSIYEGNEMQRCLRDINVAAQHLMVSTSAYEQLGKVRLGSGDVEIMG